MPTQFTIPLRPGSDGDYTNRPSDSSVYKIVEVPILYLEKIGQQWMEDRGEAKAGAKYILERLPAGYALYQRARTDGTLDKYLFGHPSQKKFDSPNRFYPHFKHMMDNNGDMIGCPCLICDPRGGILPGRPASTSAHFNSSKGSSGVSSRKSSDSSSSLRKCTFKTSNQSANKPANKVPYKSKGRPKVTVAGMDSTRVDDEGTPDVYRNLIDRLKRHGSLDENIKEPLSLDWRAEQDLIPELMRKLQRDPQWIPRVGDVVLYVRNVPEGFEIQQNWLTGQYVICDPQDEDRKDTPVWEAGLIGQAPADPPGGVEGDQWYVSQSGVRVEPLPDPNDNNKSLSKQYTYVPVEHTRPFFLWEEYVGNLSREERHPTIQNAFTISATMSLLGKHRFQGTWPNAQIFCHGIYVGTELIVVGDTVRLTPKAGDGHDATTDVLVVKSIRLKLSNLNNASSNDYDNGHPYNSEVWVYGSGYTTTASRSSKEWLSEGNTANPKSAAGYGDWYPLHAPNKELAVPFSRFVGRLHEQEAMASWVPEPDLDTGRDGVLDARNYSSKNDKRIVENAGTTWFWAESRADALDLQTINGVNVGKHDPDRDPKEWRKKVKIMEAGANTGAGAGVGVSNGEPAAGIRSLRGFMAPNTAKHLPLRTGDAQCEGSMPGSSITGKKRRVIDVSDDEEDDEILRQTRIVTGQPYKKHKIQVLIN